LEALTLINANAVLDNKTVKVVYSKIMPANASDAVFVEIALAPPVRPLPNFYVLLGAGEQPIPVAGRYRDAVALKDMEVDQCKYNGIGAWYSCAATSKILTCWQSS
jgi:hypothetical protein